MTFSEFVKDFLIPVIALTLMLVDRTRTIRSARSAEGLLKTQLATERSEIEKRLDAQYREQISYLREQLDDCLEASRPEKPKRKPAQGV